MHPTERVLARRLAAKSGGKYTVEEIENALRTAGNTETEQSVVAGMLVDPTQRDAIYDKGAVWTQGADGWLVQVLPPQPDAELVAYIKQSTGQTYDWYTPSSGGVNKDPNIPRDRMTGQPLDAKGRYSQTVVLDGKAFEPKYFQCATTECIRTGSNLDMGDPASQAYIKALDAQIFKDIGKGATVGSLVTPVGAAGNALFVLGLLASGGEVVTSQAVLETARDEVLNEIAEKGGEAVFREILGHTPAVAARAAALINLAGGWEAFTERVKTDLLGIKSNEQKK